MSKISFIPIGGIGSVTRNMYLYESDTQILIVDCGLGFPDRTLMPGVDLLLPDVSYIKNTSKKIVGMILTHGHEDHIGALPFVLPSLPPFPIFGSRLTAGLANEKLKEFSLKRNVETISFDQVLQLGDFNVSFIRVTHSIMDAANLFIKTQAGNFYHGSDFKFDFTPVDGKPSELGKIAKMADEGVLCLFSDCLGSLREGHSASEKKLYESFEDEFRKTKGKIFVTTYSSNISRLNQAIEIASKLGRKICFMGRSLMKARDVARSLNYMKYPRSIEITPHEVKKFKPSQVLILVAGSQAQEDSALVRVVQGDDRDIKMTLDDTVIFSSDPIPGNEISINSLIDKMLKIGVKVVYSEITDEFHVSGHGSSSDLKLLISLVRPKYFVPISGAYKHMVGYRNIVKSMDYRENQVFLADGGQEIVFEQNRANFGKRIKQSNVFVDEISGEEIENFVLIDRLKISKEGIVVVIVEIDSSTGFLIDKPDIFTRGFAYKDTIGLSLRLQAVLSDILEKKGKGLDPVYLRKLIEKRAEEMLFREGREPLVIPVVLEV